MAISAFSQNYYRVKYPSRSAFFKLVMKSIDVFDAIETVKAEIPDVTEHFLNSIDGKEKIRVLHFVKGRSIVFKPDYSDIQIVDDIGYLLRTNMVIWDVTLDDDSRISLLEKLNV